MELISRKSTILCSAIKFSRIPLRWKSYKPPFSQEFTVSPFSNLKVSCNFNVAVQPLSVNKYINQDKIIINMLCYKATEIPAVECEQKGDTIQIKSCGDYADCLCIVEAPIKANIDVDAASGCVNVGSFENDRLNIQTTTGSANIDKFQCHDFNVSTESGGITCNKTTQAMNISLSTNSGSIKTDKLQGRNLVIKTESGNVSTQASYCDKSLFSSKTGSFYLQNVHRDCKISIEEEGYVSLMVFDGTLELNLKRAVADVLLSRILGNSSIKIEEAGMLNLKVVETCFEETAFRIDAKSCAGKSDFSKEGNLFVFRPKNKEHNVMNVVCKNCAVNVENTTILELFRLLK